MRWCVPPSNGSADCPVEPADSVHGPGTGKRLHIPALEPVADELRRAGCQVPDKYRTDQKVEGRRTVIDKLIVLEQQFLAGLRSALLSDHYRGLVILVVRALFNDVSRRHDRTSIGNVDLITCCPVRPVLDVVVGEDRASGTRFDVMGDERLEKA